MRHRGRPLERGCGKRSIRGWRWYGDCFREKHIDTSTRPVAQRRDALKEGLPHVVQCLKSHRANLIGDGCIDDYVALDWLEWRGGHLQLTVVGQNICRQIVLASAPAVY